MKFLNAINLFLVFFVKLRPSPLFCWWFFNKWLPNLVFNHFLGELQFISGLLEDFLNLFTRSLFVVWNIFRTDDHSQLFSAVSSHNLRVVAILWKFRKHIDCSFQNVW